MKSKLPAGALAYMTRGAARSEPAMMRKPIYLASVLCAVFAIHAHRVSALQYERYAFDDGDALVQARGPIVKGDTERLSKFVASMQARGDRVIGLLLDSPGGSLIEAETLAGKIRQSNFGVFVPPASECSSACFLLFAAAPRRLTAPDALIGIHSASENGEETTFAMGITTAMARDLGGYGVPDAIVGKLVQTPPGRTTWLLPSDLASMDVKIIPDKNAPTKPSTPQSEPTPSKSPAYQEGLAARRGVEAWFAGLNGDYRAGADYWAGQRSSSKSGSCYSPPAQYSKAWTDGCLEALRRFTPTDTRRKSEPEYKEGWNSYLPT